ncbi:Gfo/Idh/MocA family protein [Streptacidiphilus sp. N1-3]|uniref:Gfo/Idh/MocA family protein n=1 Tax=Streptacidiphilus alkalitolerans TaxID=3342712 RepID=A0ABV6X2Y2_9ACTN
MATEAPGTFALIGTGWRSEFFLRLARQAPTRLRVSGVVSRSAERGARITEAWGVPVFRSTEELLGAVDSEFVIPCVPWDASPGVITELVRAGARVLAETPPAPDLAGLRELWAAVGGSGAVQVAEQYTRMPAHAVRGTLVDRGSIGEVGSVQISSTHLYHAVALIRRLLGVGFTPATVRARSFTAPLVDPLNRDGWTGDAAAKPAATTLATLDFGGPMGLYDFTDNQWWNPLRARRLTVRGSHGEIVDDTVTRLLDARSVVDSPLVRRRAGVDLNLEGVDLDHISVDGEVLWRNRLVGSRLSEDDLAVTDLLLDTVAWSRGEGPAPYPLAEGCQDHQLSLAIEESLRTGAAVITTREPWAEPA